MDASVGILEERLCTVEGQCLALLAIQPQFVAGAASICIRAGRSAFPKSFLSRLKSEVDG